MVGAAAAARTALEVALQVDAREEAALALGVVGLAELHLGDPDAGLAHVHAAWQHALALGHVSGVALAYERLAGALAALGRTEEAEALAAEGIAEADRRGLDRTFGVLLRASAADALLELGRWPEAAALIREGLAGVPSGIEGVAIHVVAARSACGQGATDRAATHLAAARELAGLPADADGTQAPWAGSQATAELLLATERPALLRDLVGTWRASPAAAAWPGQRAALLLLGLAAEVELATAARVHGDAPSLAAARQRAAALDDAAGSPWPGAATALRDAVAAASRAERARLDGPVPPATWGAVASAWAEAGRPVAAADRGPACCGGGPRRWVDATRRRSALRHALGIVIGVGAAPLEARIRDLARRARLDLEPAPSATTPHRARRAARAPGSPAGSSRC